MGDPATGRRRRRVAVVPYPGRGHINPMMSFCKLMASKRPDIEIHVIVTDEWFRLLTSDEAGRYSAGTGISFTTVPNVLPSEAVRGSDLAGFLEAVQTELEGPVEEALDAIGAPIDLIIADSFVGWAVDLGRRRNIKVASFWPAAVLTLLLVVSRFDLIPKLLAENAEEERFEIPGICSIRKVDLPMSLQPSDKRVADLVVKAVSSTTKADCVLFRSLEEFEAPAIHAMEADLPFPVFTIGPSIPYIKINTNPSLQDGEPSYIGWLNTQQERSVLYVSLGSFMSASSPQMDELAAGLKASNVPFLWAGRSLSSELPKDNGMVVRWCDQMRVLSHPSVGGFLTHCGWNSTIEAAFAGVPTLTFPLISEQVLNSKIMVEDCGIGWRMKDRLDELVGREGIEVMLKRFMDLNCSERRELDRACNELQAQLLESVEEDGSTRGLDGFLSKMIPA